MISEQTKNTIIHNLLTMIDADINEFDSIEIDSIKIKETTVCGMPIYRIDCINKYGQYIDWADYQTLEIL